MENRKLALTNTVNQSNQLSQKLQYHDKMSVLTSQEKIIVFFLASCIDPSDQSFQEIRLSIRDFCTLLQINLGGGKQRRLLEDALYRLCTKGFWIVSKGGKRKEFGRWLSKGVIDYDLNEITLKLDDSLRPFFLGLRDSARTIFQLGYTVRFKRKHTCDLYALCKSAAGLKYWNITWDELQGLLGGGYTRYYDMNKRVLQPCINEINEKSDIIVQYKPVKAHGKIIGITFMIRSKTMEEKRRMGIEEQKFEGTKKHDLYFAATAVFPELTQVQDTDDQYRLYAQEEKLQRQIISKNT